MVIENIQYITLLALEKILIQQIFIKHLMSTFTNLGALNLNINWTRSWPHVTVSRKFLQAVTCPNINGWLCIKMKDFYPGKEA